MSAAEAADAFVSVASAKLPDAARRELLELGAEPVGSADDFRLAAWAIKSRVNIAAMREWAMGILRCAPRMSDAEREAFIAGGLQLSSWTPVGAAPEWTADLRQLNALPRDLGRQSVSDRVAADYEEIYRSAEDPHLVLSRTFQPRIVLQGGTRLWNDELVLAPIDADPSIETREHFLERARDHFDGRKLRCERIAGAGAALPPRGLPELWEHAHWVVWYQLNPGKTFDDLVAAIEADERAAPDDRWFKNVKNVRTYVRARTVEQAVRRFATAIALELRPPARAVGRPPKRRN